MRKTKAPIDAKLMGRAIRRLRRKGNLTQKELADACCISVQFVSMVENGVRGVSTPTLNRIAEALGVPSSIIVFMGTSFDWSQEGPERELTENIRALIDTCLEEPTSIVN